MRNKNARLEVIKMIISSQEISSQEQLIMELDKAGFNSTQATLSRDLKQLKITKATTSKGELIYVLPDQPLYRRVAEGRMCAANAWQSGVLRVNFSGNLAVVHTLPGHAGHIAYDIDLARPAEIIGTIAGDDTVLLVLAQGVTPNKVLGVLSGVFPRMKCESDDLKK